MDKKKYQILVKKHCPKENRLLNGLVAFLVGGFMGIIGQFLIDFYKNTFSLSQNYSSALMIITLIFISCLLTSLGFFDKLVEHAKCGLIIPITGFAHSMMSASIDYKKEGLVTGIGSNMFKLAGSVIVYGVVSSYFFGLIRYLISGGMA
ncbi:MAG: stage V sporulation protein AC [Bacilli bacterium]|nr:stage V sporulation protein AC [Bacilli bacterium]